MGKYYWDPQNRKWVPRAVRRWRKPAGPAIHSDILDALWAPFNGRRYDSKARLNADAKALGLECVGNDRTFLEPRAHTIETAPGLGQDIARAYDEVTQK